MSSKSAEFERLFDVWKRTQTQEDRNRLVDSAAGRLRELASLMLPRGDRVRRFETSDDLCQQFSVRLLRYLDRQQPQTAQEFMALSSHMIRRELANFARTYFRPTGEGQMVVGPFDSQQPIGGQGGESVDTPSVQVIKQDAWQRFYQAVESLEESDRSLFDMLWTQNATQSEAAELLGISQSEVSRRWIRLRLSLGQHLKDIEF